MKRLTWIAGILVVGTLLLADARAQPTFELQNGDRVVFLGNTFVERAQKSGYLETALTSRYPDRDIVFRNLGWDGDTVFAASRGMFDPPAKGYQRMIEHIQRLDPTVILVAYGTNESFAGPAGLPRFLEQFQTLLTDLEATGTRIVILSPHRHENLGFPLPNPRRNNENLKLYSESIRQVARERGFRYVDLFSTLIPPQEGITDRPLTNNTMHLTSAGYRRAAQILEEQLLVSGADSSSETSPDSNWKISLTAGGEVSNIAGTKVANVLARGTGLEFQVTDARLPALHRPANRTLRVQQLPAGTYTLIVDGRSVVRRSADEWGQGVVIDSGPDFQQAEQLREAIIEKNLLYFHRWRPQNITYLFGFRKHEQGQNAKEVQEFEALVAEKEAQIARLRVPVTRKYQLVREGQ